MSDLVYYCLVAAAYHATCAAWLITALEDDLAKLYTDIPPSLPLLTINLGLNGIYTHNK